MARQNSPSCGPPARTVSHSRSIWGRRVSPHDQAREGTSRTAAFGDGDTPHTVILDNSSETVYPGTRAESATPVDASAFSVGDYVYAVLSVSSDVAGSDVQSPVRRSRWRSSMTPVPRELTGSDCGREPGALPVVVAKRHLSAFLTTSSIRIAVRLPGRPWTGRRGSGWGGPFVTRRAADFDRVTLGSRADPNVSSTDCAVDHATFGPPRSLGAHRPEASARAHPGGLARTRPGPPLLGSCNCANRPAERTSARPSAGARTGRDRAAAVRVGEA
jgi:hypothetical protein